MKTAYLVSYSKYIDIISINEYINQFILKYPNFPKIIFQDNSPIEINDRNYYKIEYQDCQETEKENLECSFNNYFDTIKLKIKISNRRFHNIYFKIENVYQKDAELYFYHICNELLKYEYPKNKKELIFNEMSYNDDKYILPIFCKKRKLKKIINFLNENLSIYYKIYIYS